MDSNETLGLLASMGRASLRRVLECDQGGRWRLLLPWSQWTDAEQAAVESISHKARTGDLEIRFRDRLRALELSGKHLRLWGDSDNRPGPQVVISLGGVLGGMLQAGQGVGAVQVQAGGQVIEIPAGAAVQAPAQLPPAVGEPGAAREPVQKTVKSGQ